MALSGFFRSFNCASGSSSYSKKRKTNKMKRNTSNLSHDGKKPSAPIDNTAQNEIISDNSEDDIVNDQTFYDIGSYKIALKRCDNGAKLADELSDLISERAKIEDTYGKSLKNWNNKWYQYLNSDSNDEYGKTMKDAWAAFAEAGSKTADVHVELSKDLINNPVNSIKEWIKSNYQKHVFNFKKTKEFEEKFQSAQKNWELLYNKMKKAEKEYKEAISDATNSEKNSKSAESNPKITSEQRFKLKDKSIKDKEEQIKAKKEYEESISQLELYRNRYVDNMNEVFKATQNFEQERMLFFKGIFINCHQLLQIQQDERYEELFNNLKLVINKIDPNNDLDWWAHNYGPGTKENWLKLTHFEVK